jgi:hypothetical protein
LKPQSFSAALSLSQLTCRGIPSGTATGSADFAPISLLSWSGESRELYRARKLNGQIEIFGQVGDLKFDNLDRRQAPFTFEDQTGLLRKSIG